jgi:hypothetical protein
VTNVNHVSVDYIEPGTAAAGTRKAGYGRISETAGIPGTRLAFTGRGAVERENSRPGDCGLPRPGLLGERRTGRRDPGRPRRP